MCQYCSQNIHLIFTGPLLQVLLCQLIGRAKLAHHCGHGISCYGGAKQAEYEWQNQTTLVHGSITASGISSYVHFKNNKNLCTYKPEQLYQTLQYCLLYFENVLITCIGSSFDFFLCGSFIFCWFVLLTHFHTFQKILFSLGSFSWLHKFLYCCFSSCKTTTVTTTTTFNFFVCHQSNFIDTNTIDTFSSSIGPRNEFDLKSSFGRQRRAATKYINNNRAIGRVTLFDIEHEAGFIFLLGEEEELVLFLSQPFS